LCIPFVTLYLLSSTLKMCFFIWESLRILDNVNIFLFYFFILIYFVVLITKLSTWYSTPWLTPSILFFFFSNGISCFYSFALGWPLTASPISASSITGLLVGAEGQGCVWGRHWPTVPRMVSNHSSPISNLHLQSSCGYWNGHLLFYVLDLFVLFFKLLIFQILSYSYSLCLSLHVWCSFSFNCICLMFHNFL
jgi:hypothetical protein